VLFFEKLK